MAEPNKPERMQQTAADLAAAARDRGMEQLEGAKGQLAEGAERVAAAVERTADELEGDGDDTVSGFGRSLAGLMRQLAGGLRERDIEQFASELGGLARRNPGVFLAGSVALGFGVSRFFKARAPQARTTHDYVWHDGAEPTRSERDDFDSEESLDLSGNPSGVERRSEADRGALDSGREGATGTQTAEAGERGEERGQSKARTAGNSKAKSQRASAGDTPPPTDGSQAPLQDGSAAARPTTGTESTFTDGTGGGALRGGKEP
jgi:hypothetical protein